MDTTDRLMMVLDNDRALYEWSSQMIATQAKRTPVLAMPEGEPDRKLGIDLDSRVEDVFVSIFEGYHEDRRPFGQVHAMSAPLSPTADPNRTSAYWLHRAGCDLVREVGTLRDVDWTQVTNRLVERVADIAGERPSDWWERMGFPTQAQRARG